MERASAHRGTLAPRNCYPRPNLAYPVHVAVNEPPSLERYPELGALAEHGPLELPAGTQPYLDEIRYPCRRLTR